ncbi:MAG TPA: hypothetical protein VMI72_03175 [Roseiarcus sp.]|nr:hypothetical protein [Roseiarcus sp.]
MTDATAIAAAPLVATLEPYIAAAVTALVGGAVTIAAHAFARWTGMQLEQAAVDKIAAAAETAAGKLVAEAGDNLATRPIRVGSPLVQSAVEDILARMPDVLKAAGVTPKAVEDMVHGAIGRLQASMTRTAPTPAIGPGAAERVPHAETIPNAQI